MTVHHSHLDGGQFGQKKSDEFRGMWTMVSLDLWRLDLSLLGVKFHEILYNDISGISDISVASLFYMTETSF